MKVIVFGATGMVGQGVVRGCVQDPDVEHVLAVGRTPTGLAQSKVEDLIHKNFTDWSSAESKLTGYDACFFCLGVSAAGMNESDYRRVTYEYTLAVANTLVRINPSMTFIYVSGEGTDSTEHGRAMWARIKGETENALLRLPFKQVYMFRPGIIKPGKGIVSKTGMYRVLYTVMSPLFPVLRAVAPHAVTSTEQVASAMLNVARSGSSKPVLRSRDINAVADPLKPTVSQTHGESPQRPWWIWLVLPLALVLLVLSVGRRSRKS